MAFTRFPGNPVLSPDPTLLWEKLGSFNGCPIEIAPDKYLLLYRAQAEMQKIAGQNISLSTIGVVESRDRLTWTNKHQLIAPSENWEQFGCEDPRVTKLEKSYYIFYTALGAWPPNHEGIKVALAKTSDFVSFEKRLVTPFNAKAMALFPEKIGKKYVAILTANTDLPPAKLAIITFEKEEDIGNEVYWQNWYREIDHHVISVMRSEDEQVELGAPPVKTAAGWLVLYSHIHNYHSEHRVFGVEALLLDLDDPQKLVGRTSFSLLTPAADYEFSGAVKNVTFPSGVLIHNGIVGLYYGTTDTHTALATIPLTELLAQIQQKTPNGGVVNRPDRLFTKFAENPIIQPIPEHAWERKYTLNPAAIYEDERVHLLYRAQGKDGVSTMGYAVSRDGFHIAERLAHPVYTPRIPEERAGVEDGRLTKIDDRIYLTYTAFDAEHPTRVAISSISVADFLAKNWSAWKSPRLISPPEHNDKDACLFPTQIRGKYIILHRLQTSIWIDIAEDLHFGPSRWLQGDILFGPRETHWDSEKIGIGPPPIQTPAGWLLLYHGISKNDLKYRMGAVLLDLEHPHRVTSRLDEPVLEPESDYQRHGARPGTVFGCGAVVIEDKLFLYYGGADQVVCVATAPLAKLLQKLEAAKM